MPQYDGPVPFHLAPYSVDFVVVQLEKVDGDVPRAHEVYVDCA